MKIEYWIKNKCEPIAYESQSLGGLLGDRMKLNRDKSLARLPFYGYLRAYAPNVAALWPSGEYLGKFVQALIYSYRYTNDQQYLEQTQRIIDTWIEAQEKDGYIGPNPDKYPTKSRLNEWFVWNHKYTLLGLLDYYAVSHGEKRVLESARKVGALMIDTYGPEKTKLDIMETYCTGMDGGSILEPMTYLYQHTGETKYLDFCEYILAAFEQDNGPKIVSELTERSGQVSKVGCGKGYEMLSCIIGIFRMYQLTGNQTFLQTAEQAWKDIVDNNLYITGTATQGELFYGNKNLPADEIDNQAFSGKNKLNVLNMGEGCVTAHWIFLNRLLFLLSNDLKYLEEIEKSLYNHLLGSQSAKTGLQAYYTALIGHKQFMEFDAYGGMPPCCLSSVLRCIATIPETVWTKFADHGFAVLMYNSGEFSENIATADGGQVFVNLKVNADIMGTGTAEISMSLKDTLKSDLNHMEVGTIRANRQDKVSAAFRLALRVPSWCRNFTVQINSAGSCQTLTGKPGTYLNLDRTWSGSEHLAISMKVADQVIEGSPTYQGYYALKHGPYILALDQQLNPNVDIDQVKINPAEDIELNSVSQLLPQDWEGNQAYSIESEGSGRLMLVPFLDAGQDGAKYRVWIPGMAATAAKSLNPSVT